MTDKKAKNTQRLCMTSIHTQNDDCHNDDDDDDGQWAQLQLTQSVGIKRQHCGMYMTMCVYLARFSHFYIAIPSNDLRMRFEHINLFQAVKNRISNEK